MNNNENILARLPRVIIERLPDYEHDLPGKARCNVWPWEDRSTVDILIGNNLVGLDADAFTQTLEFEFHYEPWVRNPALVAGDSYPSTPSRMRNEVRIAIEREREWTRTKFISIDAYSPKNNPKIWGPMTGDPSEPGSLRCDPSNPFEGLGPYDPEKHEIIPKKWDHEHCAMCLARIDEDRPSCYSNTNGEWLCDGCHQKYAIEGSLDFLADYRE